MAIKILNSIKYIVTIIFLFVGIFYIFNGNKILKDLTLDEKKLYVPSDLKNNTESNEEKLHINKDINEEKNLFGRGEKTEPFLWEKLEKLMKVSD